MPVVDTTLALAGRVSVENVDAEVGRESVDVSPGDPEEDPGAEVLRLV